VHLFNAGLDLARSLPGGTYAALDLLGASDPTDAHRPIELRLDKVGFRPVTEKIELGPGETKSRSFKLVEDNGTLILDGLPPQATIYVDDKQAEAKGPLVLSLGEHRLRAETAAAGVVWSQDINVTPGKQTIRVSGPKKGAKTK